MHDLWRQIHGDVSPVRPGPPPKAWSTVLANGRQRAPAQVRIIRIGKGATASFDPIRRPFVLEERAVSDRSCSIVHPWCGWLPSMSVGRASTPSTRPQTNVRDGNGSWRRVAQGRMAHVRVSTASTTTPGGDPQEGWSAKKATADALRRRRIVGCLRMRSSTAHARRRAYDATRAALDAGLEAFEATLDSPHAMDVLQKVAEEYPHVLLGCGTAIDERRVANVVCKELHFVTSPTRSRDASTWIARQRKDVLFVPGVATPTEAQAAWCEDGWPMLKVYPAKRETVAALRLVTPEAMLMASGGLCVEDVPNLIAAGADAVVLGSALFDVHAVAHGETRRIQEGVRDAIRKAKEAEQMQAERRAREAEMWRGNEARDPCATG